MVLADLNETWGFHKSGAPFSGGTGRKDYSMLGSTLGPCNPKPMLGPCMYETIDPRQLTTEHKQKPRSGQGNKTGLCGLGFRGLGFRV